MFILVVLFVLISFGAGMFVGAKYKDQIMPMFDKFLGKFKKNK